MLENYLRIESMKLKSPGDDDKMKETSSNL